MKNILRLEELAMFLFSIFLFNQLHFAWWWFIILILIPDISMIGYLVNNKVGALCYNLVHHKGIALAIYVVGYYTHNEVLQLSGIILFGHSSMDRMMGYGLKYETGFTFTHLGAIGKNKI
ncbi:MAG TPA: DUF4260 domain-containing protein [Puia sp.]|jgi:hypothetical protein|nr:DUF4260 domain-containing protein [Puia sp.]